ncbi:Protein CBG11562 [Caenorhabditis briggsae]|uniref:Protein CBG11562 n=1 Tax=Caenorhabditis briggsae TaxID=6238 RepID=A8XDH9_CAEBR|nr:Protein CBG11562 [Caenorhabditis briggsae]CAP30698.1 Protein CBG11562 [Caenorhabditis briggsae]
MVYPNPLILIDAEQSISDDHSNTMKFVLLLLIPTLSSAQLDLSAIKKQATTPSGPTVSTAVATTTTKMLDVLTQSTAEEECVSLGAHLASFETPEEATAIKNLVLFAPLFSDDLQTFWSSSQESWIGLSKTSNGAWKWSDSTEVDFTNLPDGTSVSEASCVSVSGKILFRNRSVFLKMNISGVWQSNKCSSTVSSFICKRTADSTA